jgi:predicted DNA-binding protein (MmcQ/YjbR family)
MDVESLRAYCLGKPGAWLDTPWADDEVLEAVGESYRLVVGKLPKGLRPAGWDA